MILTIWIPETERSCFLYASTGGGLWSHHFTPRYGSRGLISVESHESIVKELEDKIKELNGILMGITL